MGKGTQSDKHIDIRSDVLEKGFIPGNVQEEVLKTHVGLLVKLVSGDVVNGEDDLDVVLLGLLEESSGLAGSVGVVKRISDLGWKNKRQTWGEEIIHCQTFFVQ